MANEILKIREIGIEEVSKKTNIESLYLEYMVDKNFDMLKRVNVLGYAKIISREFGLNLDDWCAEFKEFSSAGGDDKNIVKVSPKIPGYKQKENGNTLTIATILAVLIAISVWLFGFSSYFDSFISLFSEGNESISYSNNTIIQEAKDNLNKNKTDELNILLSQDNKNDENMSFNSTILDTNENKIEIKIEPNSSVNLDEANLSANSLTNLDVNSQDEVRNDANLSKDIATFTPQKKVWIGVRDLNSGKHRTFITSERFELSLDQNALVMTGHGEIDVEAGDQNANSNNKKSKKFLIENGTIRLISNDEFTKLNKGLRW